MMRKSYEGPSVTDYGTLFDLTASVHPMIGMATGYDMSFSSPGLLRECWAEARKRLLQVPIA